MAESADTLPHKPARLCKPVAKAAYQRWMIVWWQFSVRDTVKRLLNPLREQTKKKAKRSTMHRLYTNEQLRQILERCEARADLHQLRLYLQFLYYTFARPRSEVRLFRVEDLRETSIWIRPDQDKARVGRHVDIPPALEQLIQARDFRKMPGYSYLFGSEGVPGAQPSGSTTFFKQLQLQLVLQSLDMQGQNYDLYGFKHTGNINLYLATKGLYAVMKQNGHTSLAMTETYLRDLGVLRNEVVMNQFPTMGE